MVSPDLLDKVEDVPVGMDWELMEGGGVWEKLVGNSIEFLEEGGSTRRIDM